MRMSIQAVADAVGCSIDVEDDVKRREVTGITWDSRKVKEGDIFLAMPGERVDGNDFISKAIGAGAGMVICTRQPGESIKALAGEFVCPLVVVEDGIAAISALASAWRDQLRCVVIGVTGSTGKTSTKDMLLSVMGQRYNTVATAGNNNNELGVPYTVLRAQKDTEVLIVEMGMRGLGQISASCAIAKPNMGIVTNVGVCHLELLGSRENIARAKGELFQALPANGLCVINGDDDMSAFLRQECAAGRPVKLFGRGEGLSPRATDVQVNAQGCAGFNVHMGEEEPVAVSLGMPGEHNVMNALAVIVAARHLGVPIASVVEGLAQATGSAMRMDITTTPAGVTVVNDAYNANPDSMKAALQTLRGMQCAGKRIAVLGDMGELGPDEAALHAQVGMVAAASRLDVLVCVGPLSRNTAQAAEQAGMPTGCISCVDDAAAAVKLLGTMLQEGDLVLVKASRFMGLEKIVEEIAK